MIVVESRPFFAFTSRVLVAEEPPVFRLVIRSPDAACLFHDRKHVPLADFGLEFENWTIVPYEMIYEGTSTSMASRKAEVG
jgi:hypothetical protein